MAEHKDNPRLPRTPIKVSLEQELLLQDLLDVTTVATNLANERRNNDYKCGRETTPVGAIKGLDKVAVILSLRNAAHGDFGLHDLLLSEEGRSLIRGVISHADRRSYDGWHKHLTSNRYRTEYKKKGNKRVRWFNQPHSKKRDSIQIPARFVTFSGDYCEVQGMGQLEIRRKDLDYSPRDLRYITIKRSGVAGWTMSVWQGNEWWGMQKASQFPHEDDYYKALCIGIDMNTSNIVSCYDGVEKWTVDLPDFTAEDKVLALCRERIAATSQGTKDYKKWTARKEKALLRKTNKLMAAHIEFVHDIIRRRPRYIVLEGINIVELAEQSDGRYRSGWMRACANQWRRLLTEKGLAAQNGISVITAPQHYPSTKLCPNHQCGVSQDMPTEVRTYECPICGAKEDRDEAAAISLYHFGLLQIQEDHEGYAPSYLRWVNTGKIA